MLFCAWLSFFLLANKKNKRLTVAVFHPLFVVAVFVPIIIIDMYKNGHFSLHLFLKHYFFIQLFLQKKQKHNKSLADRKVNII